MRAVVKRWSYLIATFGLGKKNIGSVEVLWPGGVRNKLFNVKAGERVLLPEIPCSFDDTSFNLLTYNQCVTDALSDLTGGPDPVLSSSDAFRLWVSALVAFVTN